MIYTSKDPEYDRFYTATYVAADLIKKFNSYSNLDSYDLIIEPSAGQGSFSNELKSYKNVVCLDIDETTPWLHNDFLTWTPNIKYNNILVIGNPPFGKKGNKAIQFINHAFEFATDVVFILPKSFVKTSMIKRLDAHIKPELILSIPDNAFYINTIEGIKEYSVPTVAIWYKKVLTYTRSYPEITESEYFKFVKKNDDHDFMLRRIGKNAGRAELSKPDSYIGHYYIKMKTEVVVDQVINAINKYGKFNIKEFSTGPLSLPKRETQIEIINILKEQYLVL
jgi:predicted RNA methylase